MEIFLFRKKSRHFHWQDPRLKLFNLHLINGNLISRDAIVLTTVWRHFRIKRKSRQSLIKSANKIYNIRSVGMMTYGRHRFRLSWRKKRTCTVRWYFWNRSDFTKKMKRETKRSISEYNNLLIQLFNILTKVTVN